MAESTTTPIFGETVVAAIGMQKGGVGKTTNAAHLAVALAELGRRVLLWDVDENHGATKLFGVPPSAFLTTFHVLSGELSAEEAVLAFDDEELDIELPDGVDLIPCSRELTGLDGALQSGDPFYNPNECLRAPIDALKALNRYDYIILDTGPSASTTTRGAYMVSDYFILSIIPEKLALESLADALEDVALARRKERNPNLHLLGLIISRMDRRVTLARRVEESIADGFRQKNQDPVKFKTTIGSAAAIDRAAHQAKTLLQTEPNHKVSQQYRELAVEMEQRIQEHRVASTDDTVTEVAHG